MANRFRQARFAFFNKLYKELRAEHPEKTLRILDLGGTTSFWKQMGFEDPNVEILVLNSSYGEALRGYDEVDSRFRLIEGDACSLEEFTDDEFDIVFSNSVIEHVGSWENQQSMMREARRVGKRYFIQTPNYFFPVEPHFHFLGFQFLPYSIRVWLVQRFALGWYERASNVDEAKELVDSCQLLSFRNLKKLDREASIFCEKFFCLNKSFVMYHGW